MQLRCFWGQCRSLALLSWIFIEAAPRCGGSREESPLFWTIINWTFFIVIHFNPLGILVILFLLIIFIIVDIIVFILYILTVGWLCSCCRRSCGEGCKIHPQVRHAGMGPVSGDCLYCIILGKCIRNPKRDEWTPCGYCIKCPWTDEETPCCCRQIRNIALDNRKDLKCDLRVDCFCCCPFEFCNNPYLKKAET